MSLNPFYGTALFQWPLKTIGNLWFSYVFQGVQKEITAMKRVKDIFNKSVSRILIFILVP